MELIVFLCSAAGMDATAQTGSHELTIPNDVSLLHPSERRAQSDAYMTVLGLQQ